MGIIATSVALAACLTLLGIAIVLDRRPYLPGKFNYIPMMILLTIASLLPACARRCVRRGNSTMPRRRKS
jgi:hypothetical protein